MTARSSTELPYYEPLGWWCRRRSQTLDSLGLLGAAYLAGVPLFAGITLPASLRTRLQSAAADVWNAGITHPAIARHRQLGPHQAFTLERLDAIRREIGAVAGLVLDTPCWLQPEAYAVLPSRPKARGSSRSHAGNVVELRSGSQLTDPDDNNPKGAA